MEMPAEFSEVGKPDDYLLVGHPAVLESGNNLFTAVAINSLLTKSLKAGSYHGCI
jgi:hypothetical protein